MKTCVRFVVRIMVGIAAAMLWMYCNLLLPYDLARGGGSLALADRAACMLTVLAMLVAPAMSIQTLFPRHAVKAVFKINASDVKLAPLELTSS